MAERKIFYLDGANGTCLWSKTEDKGPVWRYNLIDREFDS